MTSQPPASSDRLASAPRRTLRPYELAVLAWLHDAGESALVEIDWREGRRSVIEYTARKLVRRGLAEARAGGGWTLTSAGLEALGAEAGAVARFALGVYEVGLAAGLPRRMVDHAALWRCECGCPASRQPCETCSVDTAERDRARRCGGSRERWTSSVERAGGIAGWWAQTRSTELNVELRLALARFVELAAERTWPTPDELWREVVGSSS